MEFFECRVVVISIVIIGAVFFAGLISCPANAHERQAGQTVVAVKPGLLSAGIAAGHRLTPDLEVDLSVDVESYIVAGADAETLGLRAFFGNSFFMRLGVGRFGTTGKHGQLTQGPGVGLVLGNDWQWKSGFVLAADWIGRAIYSSRDRVGDTHSRKLEQIILLPKLRLGLAW